MNRDDIIRMGRDAGFEDHSNPELWDCMVVSHEGIERFANLVAAHEREACATMCDEQGKGRKALEHYAALTYSGAAHDCAVAIRARGQA